MDLRFNAEGNLPPGIHELSWEQFKMVFGVTNHRRRLLNGMEKALLNLKAAGCRRVYIDGSFVTDKESVLGAPPNDFDGCWDTLGVDPTKLDPVLLDFSNSRAAQKLKYSGELFPATVSEAKSGTTFLEFFQIDKQTGGRKGIITIDLNQFP